MRRPRITDGQMDLLAERLSAAGVGRRDFLKIAGALATLGVAGFNATPVSAAPTLAPGEKLAKDQTLRRRLVVAVVGGPSGAGLARPESLQRLAGDLGVADVVRFVPPVPQEELPDWYVAQIRHLAPFDTLGSPAVPTLLLQGETGTGKGMMARVIHDSGPRAAGPLIEVNCDAQDQITNS